MKSGQAVCNYAILQFLPYPETGEFVNVGVLVACRQPCFLDFAAESTMSERIKAFFPRQREQTFTAALEAFKSDMERVTNAACDPQKCLLVFNEIARRRESLFRFGEVRTILTDHPHHLAEELFGRYVQMEAHVPIQPLRA